MEHSAFDIEEAYLLKAFKLRAWLGVTGEYLIPGFMNEQLWLWNMELQWAGERSGCLYAYWMH
jgi:hypothetical protein